MPVGVSAIRETNFFSYFYRQVQTQTLPHLISPFLLGTMFCIVDLHPSCQQCHTVLGDSKRCKGVGGDKREGNLGFVSNIFSRL